MRKWPVAALQRALLRPLQIGRLGPDLMNGEPDCSLSRVSFGSFSDLDAALVKVRFMPLNGRDRRKGQDASVASLAGLLPVVDLMDKHLRLEHGTSALEPSLTSIPKRSHGLVG